MYSRYVHKSWQRESKFSEKFEGFKNDKEVQDSMHKLLKQKEYV